jgi:tRNA threonylcarbamoyl adenosine modification protein (Sua5/YciO/YrdC/YwlC family)
MNVNILPLNDPGLPRTIEELLELGGVLVFPTDTVVGLGGNPWDEKTVARVRRLKGRTPDQPFTLHLPTVAMIAQFATTSSRTQSILERYLPGPYTFLLPSIPGIPPAVEKEGKIGIRVPNHRFFSSLMATLDRPLFGTSVNRSGEPPLSAIEQIVERFPEIDLIVTDTGKIGRPSSIVDLTSDPPRALRGVLPEGLR